MVNVVIKKIKTIKEIKREVSIEIFLKKKKRKEKPNDIVIKVSPKIKRERLIEYH